MKFFFDESGDFRIPENEKEHKVGVVLGVVISELVEEELYEKFDNFVSGLDTSEFENGEPKGSLLTNKSKVKFCKLLNNFEGILLTPVTLDLSSLFYVGYTNFNKEMAEMLAFNAQRMKYETMKEELLLLSRQAGNLSPEQATRIYSIANCFRKALKHAIIFLSEGDYEICWEELEYIVDQYQVSKNSREEQLFSKIILAWLAGWSRKHPFIQIKEIHTEDHIIMKKYHFGYAFNLGALLQDKIYWKDSSNVKGLQIADIAANIVYRASTELNDKNDSVSIFSSLMRSSRYGYSQGPGLFTPISLVDFNNEKFLPLIHAMKERDEISQKIEKKYM